MLENPLKLLQISNCVVPMSNLHSHKINYFGNHIHHVMTNDRNQKSIKKVSQGCRLSFKFMLKCFKPKIVDNPLPHYTYIFFNNDCAVLIFTLQSSKITDFYNDIHGRRQ